MEDRRSIPSDPDPSHHRDRSRSSDSNASSSSARQQLRPAEVGCESNKSYEDIIPMRALFTWNEMSFSRVTAGNSFLPLTGDYAIDVKPLDAVDSGAVIIPEDRPRDERLDPVLSHGLRKSFNNSIAAAKALTNAETVSLYGYDPTKLLLTPVCSTDEREVAMRIHNSMAGETFRTGQSKRLSSFDTVGSNHGHDVYVRSLDGGSTAQRQGSCCLCVPVLDEHGMWLLS